MKKAIFILFIWLQIHLSLGQNFETNWMHCFGTETLDEGCDIVKTKSGYLILGNTEQKDIWLGKTDFDGNLLWHRSFGGSRQDYGIRLLKKSDNNYYIVGGTYSSDGDIIFDPYPNSDNVWIINVDSIGNILSSKLYGGPGREDVYDATICDDGSLNIFTGALDCGGDVPYCFGYFDFWFLKIDTLGNILWNFVLGSTSQDIPTTILNTKDGGFLLGGSTAPPITPGGNLTCQPFGNVFDVILTKIDSLGNIEWQQCYGGSEDEEVNEIIEVDNGYMVLCGSNSNDGDLTNAGYHLGYVPSGTQTFDVWLLNIDLNGNLISSRCYGGSGMEISSRIFTTAKGYRLFTSSDSFDGDVDGNHSWGPGWSDIWTFELDSLGDILSNQCFGSYSYERIHKGVIKLSDYEYVIAGHTISYDWWCSYEYDIIWMKITDTVSIGIDEAELSNKILISPNPAKDILMIENKEPVLIDIFITDLCGIRRKEINAIPGSNQISIDDLASGMYIYSFTYRNVSFSGKMIVQK